MGKNIQYLILALLISSAAFGQNKLYHEQYRPQIHFSPPAHWMNDPNGLVYYNGTYNLFYQYYPKATVWGPMHWGHATSTDLVHWTNKPIALYPDSLGLIFSGSAVVDYHNTSGFGKNDKPAMVAIFTHHNQSREKDGKNDTENESIAYSNDEGKTWTKYAHNPVLVNPGISDFRDPKVSWYEPQEKWVMTLATKDKITFYSSPNLKEWTKESEFGDNLGAHGGVWECPDLFPLIAADGKKMWVLVVNINPGGPQGGSATQYFTGDFDGKTFTPNYTHTRWIDAGSDEYAGVTWSNTGNRRLFLGWMSNWQYATIVPTEKWRSATTVPRELKLIKAGNVYYVASEPVKELGRLKNGTTAYQHINVNGDMNLTKLLKRNDKQYQLSISTAHLKSFSLTISNTLDENVVLGFDEKENAWYIDRTNAGRSDFRKDFAKRLTFPRIAKTKNSDLTVIVDAASVELFADKGLTAMTSIFFPQKPLDHIVLNAKGIVISGLQYSGLKGIWP